MLNELHGSKRDIMRAALSSYIENFVDEMRERDVPQLTLEADVKTLLVIDNALLFLPESCDLDAALDTLAIMCDRYVDALVE